MPTHILRAAFVAALGIGSAGCESSAPPDGVERWAADLKSTQQVLLMNLKRDGSTVTGDGMLASLTNPGGEPLTVTGTRYGDSLRVFYNRQSADPFRFVGRYTGLALVGILDGGEFAAVGTSFRSR